MKIKPIHCINKKKLLQIGITEDELDRKAKLAYSIFGEEFFDEQEKRFLEQDKHGLAKQFNQNPIFSWMRSGDIGAIIEFCSFMDCLEVFKEHSKFQDYVARLKQKGKQSHSAIFELKVAKRCLDFGGKVDLEKKIGEFAPIEISCVKDEVEFLFECKSKEKSLYNEEFEDRLLKGLRTFGNKFPIGTGIRVELKEKIKNDTEFKKINSVIVKKLSPKVKNIPIQKEVIRVGCEFGYMDILRYPLEDWGDAWNAIVKAGAAQILTVSHVKRDKDNPEHPDMEKAEETPKSYIWALQYPCEDKEKGVQKENKDFSQILKKAISQQKHFIDNGNEVVIAVDRKFCPHLNNQFKKWIKSIYSQENLSIIAIELSTNRKEGLSSVLIKTIKTSGKYKKILSGL